MEQHRPSVPPWMSPRGSRGRESPSLLSTAGEHRSGVPISGLCLLRDSHCSRRGSASTAALPRGLRQGRASLLEPRSKTGTQ